MRTGFIFPGQGSQHTGMGYDLYTSYSTIRDLFHTANDHLGVDLADLCFNGPDSRLKPTEIAQLALFVVSAAWLEIAKQSGIKATCLAGHSLGELTAYYAAGVYDFKTALSVIQKRSTCMATAYDATDAAMIAIIGALDDNTIQKHTSDKAVIANYNAPNQWVISGQKQAVYDLAETLKQVGAKRVIPLAVSGPFHSPLMTHAVSEFQDYLTNITFKSADTPIILNRTATAETDADRLKENLPQQIVSPVHWVASIRAMQLTDVYEIGSGRVLSGLVRKIDPSITCHQLETLQ